MYVVFHSNFAAYICVPALYAGTLKTSFDRVMIPTRGSSKQTHPSMCTDDRAGNTVSSVCITNDIDMVVQRQI